jgi:hypothetical protein
VTLTPPVATDHDGTRFLTSLAVKCCHTPDGIGASVLRRG